MGRPVVHWEFWSEDPEKVSTFYKKVFDWEVRHIPEMNYRLVETGGEGGINGGIMKPPKGPWPGKLAFYIDVDDLDVYGKKIADAGGKVIVDKMDVPNVGQFSLFEDPEGRVLGDVDAAEIDAVIRLRRRLQERPGGWIGGAAEAGGQGEAGRGGA